MKTITVVGKRWFKKGPGNTYHSVRITIDGEQVAYIPYSYGYGSCWEDTAKDWLVKNGHFEGIEKHERIGDYAQRKNIVYVSMVDDVPRKKDL